MKTKIFIITVFASFWANGIFAQDRTTVTATTDDISDNLDLRAVASIFGNSENLEDFERRLNDPKTQISNLDLNGDNQVDYLRVIESVEGNTHLVIVQAVLEKDVFQDVATIEVERDSNNQVQVQVVGDVYMYGNNYIYEPVYVNTPIIYNAFWVSGYRPYYSSWYWGYYPNYYYAWNPYPIYGYRNHIHVHINSHNHYNYVNVRRSQRAAALHGNYRANGYATRYPERAFNRRNANVSNRYELVQARSANTGAIRNAAANTRAASNGRNTTATVNHSATTNTRSNTGVRNTTAGTRAVTSPSTRNSSSNANRAATPTRIVTVPTSSRAQSPNRAVNNTSTKAAQTPRAAPARVESQTSNIRTESPRVNVQSQRGSSGSNNTVRSTPASQNTQRSAASQGGNGQRGSGRR